MSAGIRNARANGKKLGRPMRTVDPDRILEMRAKGQTLEQSAPDSRTRQLKALTKRTRENGKKRTLSSECF